MTFTGEKKRLHIIENLVKFGDEEIEINPLSLENCLKLLMLMSPHIVQLEHHWPEIDNALKSTDGSRSQVLFHTFIILRHELAGLPGDISKTIALLLDKDVEWVARNVKAQEFLEALPVLDRVNDFRQLWQLSKALGIKVRYKL